MTGLPALGAVRPSLVELDLDVPVRSTRAHWGERAVEKPNNYVLGGSSSVAGQRTSSLVDLRARERLAAGSLLRKRDLAGLMARIEQIRQLNHVEVRRLGEVAGHALHAIHFGSLETPRLRVLVTAGLHGNEIAGPAAAALLMDQLLAYPELREKVDVTVVPCINPVGFLANTRMNGDGLDLNRFFCDATDVPLEVALTRRFMRNRDFDLVVDLHSAKSAVQGFFGLHRNGRGLMAAAMARFARDHAVLTKRGGTYVYEAPGIYHSNNRRTLKDYAVDRCGAKAAVTIEAPRRFSYVERVTGLADLVHDIVAAMEARGHWDT